MIVRRPAEGSRDFLDPFFFVGVFGQLDRLHAPEYPWDVFTLQPVRITHDDGYQTPSKSYLAKSVLDIREHPSRTHRIRCQQHDHRLRLLQRPAHDGCPVVSRHDLTDRIPDFQTRSLQDSGNPASERLIGMRVTYKDLHSAVPFAPYMIIWQ